MDRPDGDPGDRGGPRDLGPFEAVRGLTVEAELPPVIHVRQQLSDEAVVDIEAATAAAMEPLRARVRPGMRIALTAGSRGIRDKPAVLRAAGATLRTMGADPFIVPAMGSHGGGVAEGQVELWPTSGSPKHRWRCPSGRRWRRSSWPGSTAGRGPPRPHRGRGRRDPRRQPDQAHTDFSGATESGLSKIVAIGLGKRSGAEAIHAFGPARLGHWIPLACGVIVGPGACWVASGSSRTGTTGRPGSRSSRHPSSAVRPRRRCCPKPSGWPRCCHSMPPTCSSSTPWAKTSRAPDVTPTSSAG